MYVQEDFDSTVGIHPTNAECFMQLQITKRSGENWVAAGGCGGGKCGWTTNKESPSSFVHALYSMRLLHALYSVCMHMVHALYCMCACMHACMHACSLLYVCMHACMRLVHALFAFMHACMRLFHACMKTIFYYFQFGHLKTRIYINNIYNSNSNNIFS